MLVSPIFKFFLTRRYRITIKGGELLKLKGAKLVLPNHPAQIDAQILGPITNKHWDIVPVISERFLKIPVVSYFLKSMNSVPVSDLSRGSRNLNVLNDIINGAKDALEKERSVIIYPAGSIKLQAEERIVNKRSTYYLAKDFPDNASIIGVRITGLWGSMWSAAWKGRKPKFGPTFLKSVFYIFANLIFFLPKRDVTYEFVDITNEVKEHAKKDRKAFNDFLENFYNANGPEEATFIRHYFFLPLIKPKGSIS
ncbi:MAG: lysophospholipid acyltransferase family protein [Crocinitomicaceae bacterium]|nr:lysophospholipid acyltransferase family protein [Crocinitomicaceae bacterium]